MPNKRVDKIISSIAFGAAVCCVPVFAEGPAAAKDDAAFLAMAAQADMTMTNLGKLAEGRASADHVKDFGKTLAQDHTSDYRELAELTGKLGDAIPKAINKENDREIQTLNRYRGKTFDKEFLARQAGEHEKLIKVFKREAEHSTNADIKAYANKALPTMERHLHEAEDLMKPTTHKG